VSLVVLDTDIASAAQRNRLPDRLRTALAGHTMCITFVTVGGADEVARSTQLGASPHRRPGQMARARSRLPSAALAGLGCGPMSARVYP
jgi:hypothetical protein